MKELFLQYWWIGAAFSVFYTAASVLWTLRAERLFRALRREHRVQTLSYDGLRSDVDDIQRFLENGNTLRSIPLFDLAPERKA